jgi:hypothetical protein
MIRSPFLVLSPDTWTIAEAKTLYGMQKVHYRHHIASAVSVIPQNEFKILPDPIMRQQIVLFFAHTGSFAKGVYRLLSVCLRCHTAGSEAMITFR